MPQGKKITPEQMEQVMELLEKGLSPRQMTTKVGLSANSIYWHLRANGVSITGRTRSVKRKEIEYSTFENLPDDILFNPKMFPSF
jgi:hypothetical protein